MSGFYARHIAPHLIHCACGSPMIARERAVIVPQAEGVVLEIGIGSGHNLRHYDASRVKRLIGIDPSPGILDIGRRRFDAAGFPVDIIEGTAEDMPLGEAMADTAVVTYTLCSVADTARVLSELRRVLKPSGRVLLLEHGRSDNASIARWQDRLNPLWKPLAAGCNMNRPVDRMLANAGYAIERMETFRLRGVPEIVGFHYRGIARPR